MCIVGVVSLTHRSPLALEVIEAVKSAGQSYPHRYLGLFQDPEALQKGIEACSVTLLVVGNEFTEGIVYEALSGYKGRVLLIGYNGNNSLASAVEAASALKSAGVHVSLYHYRLGPGRRGLEDYLRVASALARISSVKIGVFGETGHRRLHSHTATSVAGEYGLRIVGVPLTRVYYYAAEIDGVEAGRLAGMYRARTSERVEDRDLEAVMRLHLAFKRFVEEEGLGAFTVDCEDAFRILGYAPCFTVSHYNSAGVVAGCEGEVSSLLGMMIASYASDEAPFEGRLGDFDDDLVVLSHCAAPLSMGSYHITTHFETERPVGVSVSVPDGKPVTIVRIDHRRKRLVAARGVTVKSSPRPHLCRTQIVVRVPFDPELLLEYGGGGHYALVYGDHVWKVGHASRLLGPGIRGPHPVKAFATLALRIARASRRLGP